MSIAVHVDQPVTGKAGRAQVYAGAIDITSPTPASLAFATFAREMTEEAFGGHDPELAQYELSVDDYATVLGALKPRFIHHPESKRLLRQLLVERGCDPASTYFDVPRLRTSTSDGYLTTGIAYAWHPHRDTWYSAPLAQLNHWMPVYEVSADNAMAFHPEYFDRAVANDSAVYNYYEWNAKHRSAATANVGKETRPLPGPTEPVDLSSSTVFVTPVGAMLQFSGHQLHSSVPNTSGRTRFSIDFRTVDVDDIRAGAGARNVDSFCTGSSIRDFICVADLSPMPDDVVALFNDGTETTGDLVYVPPTQAEPARV
ncbi:MULTISPECIES: hypothetical protein [unclassified Mycobacterium]|uniref:hypothetical protein n=1 Tax=unclassified Mycobacterium TaxID=2642494 RepID=UPI0029C6D239|nr:MULTISPECIES: hypothetical protein [unclassified Mycobacterium]